jgi:ribosomal protein L25 (general stress protein Ctc)
MGDKEKNKDKKAKKGAMKEKIQKMKEKAKKWKKEKPAQGSIHVSTRPTKNQQQGVADQKKAEKYGQRTRFGGVGRTARGGGGSLTNPVIEALLKDRVESQAGKIDALTQGFKDLKEQIGKSSTATSAAPEIALPAPITITVPEVSVPVDDVVIDEAEEDEYDPEPLPVDEYDARVQTNVAPVSDAKAVEEKPEFYSQEFDVNLNGSPKTMRVEFDRQRKLKYSVEDGNPVEGNWEDIRSKLKQGGVAVPDIDKFYDKVQASKKWTRGRSTLYTLSGGDNARDLRIKVYPDEKMTFRYEGDKKENKNIVIEPHAFAQALRKEGVKTSDINTMLDDWSSKAPSWRKEQVQALKDQLAEYDVYRRKWVSKDKNLELIMTPDVVKVANYRGGTWQYRTFHAGMENQLENFVGPRKDEVIKQWEKIRNLHQEKATPPGSQPLKFPGWFSREPAPTEQEMRDRKHWQRGRKKFFDKDEKSEWATIQKQVPDVKKRNPNARTIKKAGETPALKPFEEEHPVLNVVKHVLTEGAKGLYETKAENMGPIARVTRASLAAGMAHWKVDDESHPVNRFAHDVIEGGLQLTEDAHNRQLRELEHKDQVDELKDKAKTRKQNRETAKTEEKAKQQRNRSKEYEDLMTNQVGLRKQLFDEQKMLIEQQKLEDDRWGKWYKAELDHLIKEYNEKKLNRDQFKKSFEDNVQTVLDNSVDFVTLKGWTAKIAKAAGGLAKEIVDIAHYVTRPDYPKWHGKNYKEIPVRYGKEMYNEAFEDAVETGKRWRTERQKEFEEEKALKKKRKEEKTAAPTASPQPSAPIPSAETVPEPSVLPNMPTPSPSPDLESMENKFRMTWTPANGGPEVHSQSAPEFTAAPSRPFGMRQQEDTRGPTAETVRKPNEPMWTPSPSTSPSVSPCAYAPSVNSVPTMSPRPTPMGIGFVGDGLYQGLKLGVSSAATDLGRAVRGVSHHAQNLALIGGHAERSI